MGIRNVLNPSWFQGHGKQSSYFEGWYFKMALPGDDGMVLAIIPGISKSADDSHAFIQVISSTRESWYVRYPADQFKAEQDRFAVSIGNSTFSLEGISLDIEDAGISLKGIIGHIDPREFPVTLTSPGIMGWYAYVQRMECFHGVVSMHHKLSGTVSLNGQQISLLHGTGYIEKDWGTSFPSAWVWMQSNRFPSGDVSCMLSVARIPFLGRSFTGFLGFVLIGKRLIRFATYTGARIEKIEHDAQRCEVTIRTRKETIRFLGQLGIASPLVAPQGGTMERMITESITGTIALSVSDHTGRISFQETGSMAGIELSETKSLAI